MENRTFAVQIVLALVAALGVGVAIGRCLALPHLSRQVNIATSALVIARTLISIIPNTNCTTQPT